MSEGAAPATARTKGRFKALQYRDYRLTFYTGIINTTGNWMEGLIRNWLVYQISGGSPLMLGLANLVHWLPFLLLSPIAGVFSDRWEKRWLLVVTQSILTIVTTLLGILTFWGKIQFWQILLLTLIHGVSEATDSPARHSLVSDLVDKETVMNAISLNSFAFYGTRLIGPAIGGYLIAAAGTGIGFLINAVTFVPYIVALLFIRPSQSGRLEGRTWQSFKDGLGYVRKNHTALTILTVVGMISVFMVSYSTLMPIFANDILRVGPEGLGLLSTAVGLGAVIGSFLLAFYSQRVTRPGRFICLTATSFGVSLLIFSLSTRFWLSLICLVATGASSTTFSSSGNAVLQTNVPANLRGRVMGVFTMTSQGSNVFGNLLIGGLGSTFGAPGGLAISSSIAIAVAILAFALAPEFRRLQTKYLEESC